MVVNDVLFEILEFSIKLYSIVLAYTICMASQVEKESKDLYHEFVLYMKNTHSKNLSSNIEIHYKQLHSELCKQNKHKRKNIIECLKNR